jgi:DNA adenine methylase
MNDQNIAANIWKDSPPAGRAAPLLKWAGGKTQLLPVLTQHLPQQLINGQIKSYIEPFIGGGAVFFHLSNSYNFDNAYLFDLNHELIVLYNTVKESVESLIAVLAELEKNYHSLSSEERANFFYQIREMYNQKSAQIKEDAAHSPINPERAAHTLFLNKTCFNGLFRVNKSGAFNVPHGDYRNPKILARDRLIAASAALSRATICLGDFTECAPLADKKSFIYYDPPYRPLSKSSSFTSYAKDSFDDNEQRRLCEFFKELDRRNALQLLSNSDPTNCSDDPFFDNLYQDFSIYRVSAKRKINSDATKRGEIRELIIKNY